MRGAEREDSALMGLELAEVVWGEEKVADLSEDQTAAISVWLN